MKTPHLSTLYTALSPEQRNEITQLLQDKCAHCGDNMYTIIRAHHHTEDGQDVTGH